MNFSRAAFARLFGLVRWLYRQEMVLSEVGSGFGLFVLGLLILRAVEIDEFWPSLHLFLGISNSYAWGIIAVLIGAGQMVLARLLDYRLLYRPWLSWTAAVLGSWIWALATISLLSGVPGSPMAAAPAAWFMVNIILIGRVFQARNRVRVAG